jgi:DNA-binding transcriptional ArsR family regulator
MSPGCANTYRVQSLAAFANLLSDPVRTAIVLALTDGSERTAGELARLAGASPQATSPHLTKLIDGGVLTVAARGRFRYFRIASGDMAELLETLSNLVDDPPLSEPSPALRRARICYDHVAGQLGCAIFEALQKSALIGAAPTGMALTEAGNVWCAGHGLAYRPRTSSRRPTILLCSDWTEKRPHLGGLLGASLADLLFRRGFIKRHDGERLIDVTLSGREFLARELSLGFDSPPDGARGRQQVVVKISK